MQSVVAVLALASTALAHGGVLSYKISGTTYNGFVPYNSPSGQSSIQREWDSYNPILDPSTSSVVCNTAGTAAQKSATVAAGSSITAYWNNPWPHNIGPVSVMMYNCGGDCSKVSGSGAGWFKINQVGLVSGTLSKGTWGSGQMISDNSSWTTTIPKTLAPGNYLIRHETIALHTANQPQFYPECAHLTITGSGTGKPSSSSTFSLPGLYQKGDPNLYFDPYSNENQQKTTWTYPGPAPWTG